MCLSTTQIWKNKTNLKGFLALLPPAETVLCFLLCPNVPCAFGFNQVQSRNSTSCCLTLIRRSQILQMGRFLLLVSLSDESFAFKYLKGTIRVKQYPSLLLFSNLFIISHSKSQILIASFIYQTENLGIQQKQVDYYRISEIVIVIISKDANCRGIKTIKILNQQTKRPRCIFPKNKRHTVSI